jgi:prepilin-type N-terminal cleavage/methylation domain-containing protein
MGVRRRGRAYCAGVTLVEMVVVLALVALVVAIGVPRADAVDAPRLDAASSEIREACRFAQAAALRGGAWYAVGFDTANQMVRVYRLNASYVEDTSVTVMDPVGKSPYRIMFGAGALGAVIAGAVFQYQNSTTTSTLAYGPDGMPAAGLDGSGNAILLKNSGVVTLRHGRTVRQVTIDAAMGKVTF